ncbi:MAG: menaquinone biosynthesis protein [Acidobacteria bacterium]|nr:menaquinone biosynthesis protein [Acidobacteriota bacterium]
MTLIPAGTGPDRLRLSIIDYLNALPLNLAFKNGLFADRTELVFDFPSVCADRLAMGEVDGGLISSIEYQRIPDLQVAEGLGIASFREVKSVVILARQPLETVKTLALDRFSRSSEALTRILFQKMFHRQPQFFSMAPNLDEMLETCDAALIIGDPALRIDKRALQVYDLAGLWYELTQLPFVFAFWALRAEKAQAKWVHMLREARRYGQAHFAERLTEWSQRWHVAEDELHRYLTQNIHYELGEAERISLDRYYQMAYSCGLIPKPRPIIWAKS